MHTTAYRLLLCNYAAGVQFDGALDYHFNRRSRIELHVVSATEYRDSSAGRAADTCTDRRAFSAAA